MVRQHPMSPFQEALVNHRSGAAGPCRSLRRHSSQAGHLARLEAITPKLSSFRFLSIGKIVNWSKFSRPGRIPTPRRKLRRPTKAAVARPGLTAAAQCSQLGRRLARPDVRIGSYACSAFQFARSDFRPPTSALRQPSPATCGQTARRFPVPFGGSRSLPRPAPSNPREGPRHRSLIRLDSGPSDMLYWVDRRQQHLLKRPERRLLAAGLPQPGAHLAGSLGGD